MRTLIAVGLAGAVGALARFGVEGWVTHKTGGAFPWGTFAVNISGSLLLGVLYSSLVEGRIIVAPWLRTATTVGLVGAYTTFSTLTLETVRLIEDGSLALAGLNAMGSLAVGLVAVYVGIVVGRLI